MAPNRDFDSGYLVQVKIVFPADLVGSPMFGENMIPAANPRHVDINIMFETGDGMANALFIHAVGALSLLDLGIASGTRYVKIRGFLNALPKNQMVQY